MSQLYPHIINITLKYLAWTIEISWYPGNGRRLINSSIRGCDWYRSQALQVMNCMLDIYPSHGGIAAVQHGIAKAAICLISYSTPITLPWHAEKPLTHIYTNCPSASQRDQSQSVTFTELNFPLCRDRHNMNNTFSVISYLVDMETNQEFKHLGSFSS